MEEESGIDSNDPQERDFSSPPLAPTAESFVPVSLDSPSSSNLKGGFSKAIEKISPAVVVLRVCYVRAFDGEGRGCSSATGFVVDKERGIILTNRHVVSCGPVQADATFLSKEEVPIKPIYRDPVHDFGFFAFDTDKVKFTKLEEIKLAPEKAKVGLEIRVVGNDAGEKLSILAGTLARLDRDAPHYGSKEYNDHNTFYIAAASSTSGGSSGSPVIDIDGDAVALNAGGKTKAASSFYLPLDRVVRALGYIQRGEAVPRRTIQCIFKHSAFTEARRLGLEEDMEASIRKTFPSATGLLVAENVVPEGPADRANVQVGDILLKLNGEFIHEFSPLADAMDDHEQVEMTFQRGNESYSVTMSTDDLHQLTPSEYVHISGAILHPLSYQQAINNSMPPGKVFVSSAGYMFGRANINWNTVVIAVGDEPTPDLDAFETAISKYPEGSNVSIRFLELKNKFREQVRSCTVDRTWFLWQRAKRYNKDGSWQTRPLAAPQEQHKPAAQHIRFSSSISPAVVMVGFDVPFQCDGIPFSSFNGTGIVVDWKNGLVVCDRNTIPNSLGNATITFGGSLEIPASVLFVHPMHNFAIVKYDPSLLDVEDNPEVSQFEFAVSDKPLAQGDSTTFVGLTYQMNQIRQRCTVTNIERLLFHLTSPPRFTARNQIVIHVDKLVSNVGGVLIDEEGKVQAFWFSFSYQSEQFKDKETFAGVPASIVFEIVDQVKKDWAKEHFVDSLATDFVVTPISKARAGMGLSEDWVKNFTENDLTNNHILTVRNVHACSNSATLLKSGDLLLAVDGKPMVNFFEADTAVKAKQSVKATILRNLNEMEISVPVSRLSCVGTSRLILFAGMFLQAPHPAVAFRGFLPETEKQGSGVYCSRWFYGSPSHRFGLKATHFVVAIDDKETPDLDAVVDIVAGIKDGQFIRIKTVSLNNMKRVFTLKCDYQFWPTVDLVRNPTDFSWQLKLIPQPDSN